MARSVNELLREADDSIGKALSDKRLLTLQHYRMLEKTRETLRKVLRDRHNHEKAQAQTTGMFGEGE